jgi:steroid 5-alpha reductase family enzyme
MNFFAENSIWWSFTLFNLSSSGEYLHWTVIGAALLSSLFMGSTWFTESITVRKYPKYKEYQRTTSAVIPWFRGKKITVD